MTDVNMTDVKMTTDTALTAAPERRNHRKEPVARAHVRAKGSLSTRALDRVEVRDLSPCGLFLACHPAPEKGAQVTVKFQLPGRKQTFELVGEVRHRTADGVGVRTVRLDYDTKLAIEAYAASSSVPVAA